VPKVFHAWLWLHARSLLLSGFKLKVSDALCIKEPGRWIAFLGLAPMVPVMPAVVVVTIAVPAAAEAVHAIT
jgi:hypothetical protein